MELASAIAEFQNLFDRVGNETKNEFIGWLKQTLITADNASEEDSKPNTDIILDSIRDDIRSSLPLNAMTNSESITSSSTGTTADCDPRTTLHVDAFLYDEDLVDELSDQGEISRNYCVNCGSHNVKPLTFITHSASLTQIKYIFHHLVPEPCRGTVVDVGSRLGAVLYGAYLYTESPNIIGIEMNETMCQLQQRILQKYQFMDRVKLIHDDVINQAETLGSADVVILNNVFEFFLPVDDQKRIWTFLHQVLRRRGSYIITVPSLEKSLSALQMPVDLSTWVRLISTEAHLASANFSLFGSEVSEESDLAEVFLYEVI